MKYLALAVIFGLGYLAANLASLTSAADPKPAIPPTVLPPNPAIDYSGYLKIAQDAATHRQTHRVTEEEFIKMSGEKDTVILDARSKELYDVLHIKGAIHLSFPDIAIESLKKTFPDKNIRILIYCNNNFKEGAGATTVMTIAPGGQLQGAQLAAVAKAAFPSKSPIASLNISTYIALFGYGYKNVYELAPLIDPTTSKLTFEATPKAK